ncbi:hypothetical protein [Aerosakkonema funiforme]|uniref:hypothetical protein n=1 Tax=Aerosakkonema funiforme TaxID=1246630 RepID=UPI0035BA10F3
MIHHIARHSAAPVVAVASSPPVLTFVASAAGITALVGGAATLGTYAGARLVGKSHKEAMKNLGKDTLEGFSKVTQVMEIANLSLNACNVAQSTISQLNQ